MRLVAASICEVRDQGSFCEPRKATISEICWRLHTPTNEARLEQRLLGRRWHALQEWAVGLHRYPSDVRGVPPRDEERPFAFGEVNEEGIEGRHGP